ncbi:hypothetical protein KY334_00755 [Candidatus Woesearchaeota archaeon]|nr:hypothetical protein [Candidatus Woesearchaeota archaeon]
MRGQVWYMDLIFGLSIFIIALLIFFSNKINLNNYDQAYLSSMIFEINSISDQIMGSGYPTNWNENNVIEIGIVDNGVINETKLNNLNDLNYNDTKRLFNTRFDYYFYIVGEQLYDNKEGYGKAGVNSTNIESIDSNQMINIDRYVVFNDKIRLLKVISWD